MDSTSAPPEQAEIRRLATAIRVLSMDAVAAAKSGHSGLPLGMADVATVLYANFLKFDPAEPHWPDRDRFVLSGGHGSMLLYSLLYLTGYGRPTLDDIRKFRQIDSPCAGHPEYGHLPGVETTTGPLGQGIANAVGMAMAERILNARFGDGLVGHKTYVIASDGDLMEGISHEAISLAGHLKLSNLIVLWDDNKISIDGAISLSDSTDVKKRFEAAGWITHECDGQDARDTHRALTAAQNADRPVMIACRTTIGFGANYAGTAKAHGAALNAADIAEAKKSADWPAEAFAIPDDVIERWRAIGARGAALSKAWHARKNASLSSKAFDEAMSGDVPAALGPAIAALKKKTSAEAKAVATRAASEAALEVVNAAWAITVGGSADLTGSNNTKTKDLADIKPGDFKGRYVRYGIREHGMAAAMNGMALHGGIVPYGGTFLVFSDYMRPAIRLAALMGIRVIFVMTHDSIGVGEDGPTHQPVEQVAALRAIPNLLVIRPADAVETAEAWELALANRNGPSLLVLSRQDLPVVRTEHSDENRTAKGAYEIAGAESAKVTLLATGSEVDLVLKARDLLKEGGIGARVVSMPCWSLFETQPDAYRSAMLGPETVKVAVEAGVRLGWDRYVGPHGRFVGMHGFGASAPYKVVYKHFGITPDAVAEAARAALKDKR